MKTHREIVTEAQRLEEAGRRFAADQRRAAGDQRVLHDAFSILFAFPESHFTGYSADDGAMHTHRRLRRIEAAIVGDSLDYCLVQDEIETTVTGAAVEEKTAVLVARSDSALDVLEKGYDLAVEERLSDALAPYLDRIDYEGIAESVDDHLVEEIGTVIGAGDLLPASRLQAKADIIKFLDGRLAPDEFITAAIARQRYCEDVCESMSERPSERVLIGQP